LIDGDADAASDGDSDGRVRVGCLPAARLGIEGDKQPTSYLARAQHVHTGQDDGKFFAAVAPDKVFQANTIAQAFSDFAQDSITGTMAVGIVDPFEVIEVYEKHGAGAARALAMRKYLIELAHDGAMIGQAGDGIRNSSPGLFAVKPVQF